MRKTFDCLVHLLNVNECTSHWFELITGASLLVKQLSVMKWISINMILIFSKKRIKKC